MKSKGEVAVEVPFGEPTKVVCKDEVGVEANGVRLALEILEKREVFVSAKTQKIA